MELQKSFESKEAVTRKVKRKWLKKWKVPKTPSDHEEQKLMYEPPVTFPCSVCQQEIAPAGTFLHKKQHDALAVLGMQWLEGKKPQASMIAIQRQSMISNLLVSLRFSEKSLQSINYAFEMLWKKQTPACYKIFSRLDQASTCSPEISHMLVKGIAISRNGNSAWKVDMNNKFTVTSNFGQKPTVCCFGLFDGHHGHTAADMVSKELPMLLLDQLSNMDPSYQMTPEQRQLIQSFNTVFREEYEALEEAFSCTYKTIKAHRQEYEDLHKAFAKAFWRMDRLLRLGRNEVSRVRWSGCSALVCLLEGGIKMPFGHKEWANYSQQFNSSPFRWMPKVISGVLHIANVGNVQAVLCRNGKGFCLTKEHTTRNINERKRVFQDGGVITSNQPYGLLEGRNVTTRGLGFHGSLKLKKSIIPAPQTISVPIDDLCQFLILATNGLWEVLDKKEVTALVITLFQVYKEAYVPDKSPPSKETHSQSGSDIHILFQYKPESAEPTLTMNVPKNVSESADSEAWIHQCKNAERAPSEVTRNPQYKKETNTFPRIDGAQDSEKAPCDGQCPKGFYEGAAEYISQELVSTALEGGSRDITVMVIFLNGIKYQPL